MNVDPEVVKWIVGISGTVITGTIMTYIGIQLRGAKDTKKDHLRRTTALEIAQVKYSSHVTTKLDALIASHQRTVGAIGDLSTAVSKITASVAHIEGVIEGTKIGASK